MASVAMSYTRIMTKVHNTLSQAIQDNNIDMLSELFDSNFSEGMKSNVEAAFRDFVLKKVCTGGKADLRQIKIIVKMTIEGARKDLCLSTLPVLILSDTFDCITIQQCEELFEFVESNVSIWKEELFFAHCKNQVLRMCNDVLRRLSRSQNTIFCGRILLFLARFFPFSERSGLNLISEFNLENVTVFTDSEVIDVEMGDDLSSDEKKTRPSIDYTLYTKFWALQDFFRNPVQCFQKPPWTLFTKYADDILDAFCSFKLDCIQASKSTESNNEKPHLETQISLEKDDQYFPKYLTNQKLLDLQFSDSNFRRYILVQMLILAQYLTSNIKSKQDNLKSDQLAWVQRMQETAFTLMAETPPNGKHFVEIVKSILKREEIWNEWKNKGCPEIKKLGTSLKRKNIEGSDASKDELINVEFMQLKKKEKRKLGDMIKEADSKGKYIMGNAEMTRLWNICPNNMEACQQECRDFVPSLESYFSVCISQISRRNSPQTNKLVNDSNFGWRGLRLLASKSPHFFTNSGNSIATLPEYFTNMIQKVAKDLPSHQAGEEEEEKDEKDEKEEKVEAIAVLDQGEGVKEEEDEEEEEDDKTTRIESKPINEEERQLLAKAIAAEGHEAWQLLGKKLDFESDELEFFIEGKTLERGIEIMLERWVENDGEEATKECLLYTLEGLKMHSVVKKVYSEL